MKSLFTSFKKEVSTAYIIRIDGNEISSSRAKRCADSCNDVHMAWKYWDAYNGTGTNIVPPMHHCSFMKMIKISNHYLTRAEIACALSHISLWVKCVIDDEPIVILEHDAVMVKNYTWHYLPNSIGFLGCIEQLSLWRVGYDTPYLTFAPSLDANIRSIYKAHAYAVDPMIAKNLLTHVLQFGIENPIDIMMRKDLFSIHQMDLYAYNGDNDESTLSNRALNQLYNYDLKL